METKAWFPYITTDKAGYLQIQQQIECPGHLGIILNENHFLSIANDGQFVFQFVPYRFNRFAINRMLILSFGNTFIYQTYGKLVYKYIQMFSIYGKLCVFVTYEDFGVFLIYDSFPNFSIYENFQ